MAQKNILKKKAYAEVYVYNSTTEFVINTADVWHSFFGLTQGHLYGWTFSAGSVGAITAFADYSGTVAGTVKATDASHGLSTGAIVSITGTTNYNGLFEITVIDDSNFYFTDTWVADDGASHWNEGGYLECCNGSAGRYRLTWNSATTTIVNNSIIDAGISLNTVMQERAITQRKFGIGADTGNMVGTAILDVAAGDKIIMNIRNVGGTGNVIPKHVNINLVKCC